MEKRLYTVAEAKEVLGIGKSKVYSLIKNGQLRAFNLSGLKIPSVEIDRFINENIEKR